MARLAWLSYPMVRTDFKDGVFGKSPFLGRKSKKILVLEKIGIMDGYQRPNEKELLRTMTVFQQIVSEIRGN